MAELDPGKVLRSIPFAHRGLHDVRNGRVENSLASFRAAVDAGYGIELDVQISADGQAMAFHDDTLDRLTAESGKVNARTAAELARIPLVGEKDGTIPTLREVLALTAGRVPLLVEIKDQDGAMGPGLAGLEDAVAHDLQDYAGPVAVMSFNPHSVARLAELLPNVPRGIVTEDFEKPEYADLPADRRARLSAIEDFGPSRAQFISCGKADLDRPPVHALKEKGVCVLTWTIRSPSQEAEARRIADNITFEGYLPAPAH